MFKHAIVRTPASSVIEGITSSPELGQPNFELALKQHQSYIKTLESCCVTVTILDPLEDYPDACFVEDVAVLTPEVAVVTHPGAATRQGEVDYIVEALKDFYSPDSLHYIQSPATLEGGDVMLIEKHFYVGLSDRTNEAGIDQFTKIVSNYGYKVTAVSFDDVLHLKTAVNYIGEDTVLISGDLVNHSSFANMREIVVPEEEAYAANSLAVNGRIIVPEGFPQTAQAIEAAGFEIVVTDTSEFRKIDGGLSCLSLRF